MTLLCLQEVVKSDVSVQTICLLSSKIIPYEVFGMWLRYFDGNLSYLHLIPAIRYSALLIPSGLGCSYDLAKHKDFGKILNEFIEDKSKYGLIFILFNIFKHLTTNSLFDLCLSQSSSSSLRLSFKCAVELLQIEYKPT